MNYAVHPQLDTARSPETSLTADLVALCHRNIPKPLLGPGGEHGHRNPLITTRLHSPRGPRVEILRLRLPEAFAETRADALDEREGQLL